MTLTKNLILALTVAGGAAFAAIVAVQRHSRRVEKIQDRTALQRWDDETGSPASPPCPQVSPDRG